MARENPTNGSRVMALQTCPTSVKCREFELFEGDFELSHSRPSHLQHRMFERLRGTFECLMPRSKRSKGPTFEHSEWTFELCTAPHQITHKLQRSNVSKERSNVPTEPIICGSQRSNVWTFERSCAEKPKLMFFRLEQFHSIPNPNNEYTCTKMSHHALPTIHSIYSNSFTWILK